MRLRLVALIAAIGLVPQAFCQSTMQTTAACSPPAIRHGHLNRLLQPSDLPEILNIYDRDTIRTLAAQPGLAQAYLACAADDIASAHYESAIRKVVNARVLDPGIPNASILVAEALNSLHRYEDAYLLLRSVPSPEADSWRAIYERARAEVGIGNSGGAELWSLRAIAVAPSTFASAHLVRSQALILAERWHEARMELDLYMKQNADASQHPEALEALNTLSHIGSNATEPAPR